MRHIYTNDTVVVFFCQQIDKKKKEETRIHTQIVQIYGVTSSLTGVEGGGEDGGGETAL